MNEQIIHIQWEGSVLYGDIYKYINKSDYGVYQVCGPHQSYGPSSLLYIGRAARREFGVRLQEEGWENWQHANGRVEIYLGRLSGSKTPDDFEWNVQIERVERLLIYAHRPSHNSSGLNRINDPDVGSLHILNWGNRGRIMPEVSGARWSPRFEVIENYRHYGEHETQG